MLPAKLLPAANNANIARITMRSRKRMMTWMDGIEAGPFLDCRTNANPRTPAYPKLSVKSGS
jgi:hypothetical protein